MSVTAPVSALGTLIPKGEVVEGMGRLVSNAKTHLLSLPQKCAPILASMNDPGECFGFLTSEIHEALERLAAGD